jgi:hypothetical protein
MTRTTDLGRAADKLHKLAAIERSLGDARGSRDTVALARQLKADASRPGDLGEAMRAFVEVTLHLADVWRNAGPQKAFVLGDSYGLDLDFEEIAARVADWNIPEGDAIRTHAGGPAAPSCTWPAPWWAERAMPQFILELEDAGISTGEQVAAILREQADRIDAGAEGDESVITALLPRSSPDQGDECREVGRWRWRRNRVA